jgi:hypothetical protein
MAKRIDRASEEQAAIDWEREAFERRQRAFFALMDHWHPSGDGIPPSAKLQESEVAEVEWRLACANMDRIAREIQIGRRT